MKGRWISTVTLLAVFLLLALVDPGLAQSPAVPSAPTGTGFTYQGQLKRDDAAVNATCQMAFRLYDDAAGGSQVGSPVTVAVAVSDGLFTVKLDFGAAFQGDARWLGIQVMCPGDGAYVDLGRQPLTAAPYALHAQQAPWSGLAGVPAGFADGVDNDTTYSAGTGLTLTGGAFSLGVPYRLPQACANGQIAEWNGSAWACGNDDVGTGGGGGDITAVYAGAGLTGGGASGDVTLGVNFSGSGSATTTARSDHNHWGQSWGGTGSGLTLSGGTVGLNASGSTSGIQGYGSNTSGAGVAGVGYVGVQGSSSSTSGRGVVGDATATNGQTYGVLGRSSSTTGMGVSGEAIVTTGANYGVAGYSPSTSGTGVYGWAGASSGATYGVHGQSSSTSGKGVYGLASASSGETYGIYGQTSSHSGAGVYGVGPTVGVKAKSTGCPGTGLYVEAGSPGDNCGTTEAVWARILGDHGIGVRGEAPERGVVGTASASSGETYGVSGSSASTSGTGVYGYASAASGTTLGVYGRSVSPTGRGVYGYATASSGVSHGVYGQSSSTGGTGVYGIAPASSGSTYGVYGQSNSTTGTGVSGVVTAQSGQTAGVSGSSASTSGRGVVGDATAPTGTTYGVIGYSASPDGYAGYFRNTSSGPALWAMTDSGTDNIIEAWSSFADVEFQVARSGNVYADGSYLSPAADFAELLPGAAGLEPGDVLVIDPDGQLARSSEPYQASVAGVYSTQPGFLAGAGDGDADLSDRIPLAVMGVVPVKATAGNGPIRPGDLLTSARVPGHAMRAGSNPPVGTVIGKALQPLAEGSGVIKMLVVLQ
jgi:hypothetical protein